ncbi:Glycosyltransferase involved in cell wall bisynthesis [Desulfacinum infernum DSM 9756]|uniref:Glycosyltransferase involved in cell wall bisynthesis n=1 Tax=Desulfacinum infernum DSM 9756 TaxID=1121391 RepID=A0A1M4SWJ4_9BACT|nr:glycosyltransferase family 1 protein [Desulfacinum infernum]SHE36594.1 Glycosyltransferase involved in cell wall bisynthesis [Desulfacinum infernum DSM 9756]
MRIVIDMQGAQTESRFRGIGRYTMNLAQAVVRNRGDHEVILALNGLLSESIEPIRAAFEGLLPQENIRVWQAPGPVREGTPGNSVRRRTAELIREAFLASLLPDVIHISSLFEGYVDDAVTSIGRFDKRTPVSVSLYDLIPLTNADHYLKPHPRYSAYYERKLSWLRKASLCLAISRSAGREAVGHLPELSGRIVNVSTAVEPRFQPLEIDETSRREICRKYSIDRPFVLYTGGADERKNLPRLLRAYAALPNHLRSSHQLVFAGRMPQGDMGRLKRESHAAGLEPHELVLTGYVSDEDLVRLYNLCRLFVFPSWHEGFGLPALEAMACGAPVIAANTSSLPEIVQFKESLFDPFRVQSITQTMQRALADEEFRNKLIQHGLKQAGHFSWDDTARKAINAWGKIAKRPKTKYGDTTLNSSRLYHALAQELPGPQAAGLPALAACLAQNALAGEERQLLLDISELSQRDAATGVQRVVKSYLKWLLQSPPPGFRVEPVYATSTGGYRYARQFTLRFLGLCEDGARDEPIRWRRGDVFFGLDMQHHVQLAHMAFFSTLRREGVNVKFLVYDLLPVQFPSLLKDRDLERLHAEWLAMIASTDGAICISKATADAYAAWLNEKGIPPARTFRVDWLHLGGDIDGSVPSKGIPAEAHQILDTLRSRTTFLCVATLEPRKCQAQILGAVEELWRQGMDVNLALVGQKGWKTEGLIERIEHHPEKEKRLFWFEGISDEYLDQVYAASTCLIAASLDEGFGLPVVEASRHGLPVVARDIPVFREVAGDNAFYFTGQSPGDLAQALKDWLDLYQAGKNPDSQKIPWMTWRESTERLKDLLVGKNYRRRQLLVDISELVRQDLGTGIQRVVRNILREWLLNPPPGWRVEPVYAAVDQPYRYARKFTAQFLGTPINGLTDDPMEFAPGDCFFVLDLQPQVQTSKAQFYQHLRRHGVTVKFLVHDLLTIRMPQYFPPGTTEGFTSWLMIVGECDGAICVSNAVAQDLRQWMRNRTWKRLRSFSLDYNHNGAELENRLKSPSRPSCTVHDDSLVALQQRPSFLMVGTLEPRKAHAQVLAAFEQLWAKGTDVNLVIVGKQGWMVEALARRIKTHPERDHRLFWLQGISDEYLERIYQRSTCLIAASYGEGFGLPLVEAAQHKLPIIARDIPVFREVAGNYAYYFKTDQPDDLAHTITIWLRLYLANRHPKSEHIPCLTWAQSARNLLSLLINAHN